MRPDRRFGLGRAWLAMALLTGASATIAPGQEWRAEKLDPKGHSGDVLAASASGKTLATAGLDGVVKVWDLGDGRRLAHRLDLVGHDGKVEAVAVSPDARVVASGGVDRTVRLWDASTGALLATLRGHTGPVEALAFGPDGKALASGGLDTVIRLWDVEAKKAGRTLQGHEQGVRGLAFRPDGKLLASAGRDATVRLWDLPEGKERTILGRHNGPAWSVAFAPDGKTLASGGLDQSLRLWRVGPTPGEPAAAPGAVEGPNAARFAEIAPRRRRIVDQVDGSTFRRDRVSFPVSFQPGDFNRSQRNQVQLWEVGADAVAVAFTPDGHDVAAALSEPRASRTTPGSVAFFAVPGAIPNQPHPAREPRATIRGHLGPILGLAFARDGRSVATVGRDASVRVWDALQATPLAASIGRSQPEAVEKRVMGHLDPVDALAITPDGLKVATASRSGGVSLWDAKSRTLLGRLSGPARPFAPPSMAPDGRVLSVGTSFNPTRALALSPDGKTLATGGDDRAISLRDLETGRSIGTLAGHLDRITALAYSPDGQTLASGSKDASVTLWDVARMVETATLARHTSAVTALAFSPDGKTVATAGLDHSVKLWEVPSGRFLDGLDAHKDAVDALGFAPDGSTLASGDRAGTVRLWDVARRSERLAIAASSGPVRALGFTLDGKTLVAGGDDGAIRRWDALDGRVISVRPDAHAGPILTLAMGRDGRTLATGGLDRELKLWDLEARVAPGRFAGVEGKVRQLAVSPDGKTLATASSDQLVRIWDAATGRERTPSIPFQSSLGEARLAFSPDSRNLATLAVGTGTDRSKVWDAATGLMKDKAARDPDESRALAFDPGGQSWATTEGNTVHIWGLGVGRQVLDFAEAAGPIRSMAFSPDGKRLAAGLLDGSVVFLGGADEPKGPETFRPSNQSIEVLTYSPDGRSIAIGGPDRVVRVLDATDGSVRLTLRGPRRPITGLAYSPDGKTLASSSDGEPVLFVWDANSGEVVSNPTLPDASGREGFACLGFSPDGQTLYAGGERGLMTFRMLEGRRPPPHVPQGASKTKERASLVGHAAGVRAVAFTEPGSKLVSRGEDGVVKVWDLLDDNRGKFTFGEPDFKAQSLAISPDGRTLAVGLRLPANRLRAEGNLAQAGPPSPRKPAAGKPTASAQKMGDEVKFWDLGSGEAGRVISAKATNGGIDRVVALAYSRDGQALATASQQGLVWLWEGESLEPRKALGGQGSPVSFVQFSPDGRTLLGADVSGQVTLWDVEKGNIREHFTHLGGINQVLVSPDGKLVATAGGHVPVAEPSRSKPGASNRSSAFNASGLGPGSGGDVRLWDLATGRRVAVLPMPSGRVTRLAFSKDGKSLAASTTAPLATVWDVGSLEPVVTLAWPSGEARALAFSPDGKVLAVGGEDETLRIWDVPKGTLRADLLGHTDAIDSLAFSPDGQTIATAGRDASIKLWDVPPSPKNE